MTGIRLACLQTGDRYDRRTGRLRPNPVKEPVTPGSEWIAGNYLIPDIGARRRRPPCPVQRRAGQHQPKATGHDAAVYARTFAHGYRFTFRKTAATRGWVGHLDDVSARAVAGVELDIEPIVQGLLPPESAAPVDLPAGRAGAACRALWFRGLLLADDQRRFCPDAPLTRADFATALAGAVRLVPPEGQLRLPPDVPETVPWAEDVAKVLAARLLEPDSEGMFRPADSVPRQLAAGALPALRGRWAVARSCRRSRLCSWTWRTWRRHVRPVGLCDDSRRVAAAQQGHFHPLRPVTRAEAADAICRLTGLSWREGGR